MYRDIRANTYGLVLAAALMVPVCTLAAPPELGMDDISWVQVGQDVQFTLTFRNPGATASDAVSGVLSSQQFGAFLENFGLICNFDVPSIPPGETWMVNCTVPLSSLPQGAEVLLPPTKPSDVPGDGLAQACTVPNWFGNVDVMFGAAPTVNAHLAGNVPVCVGGGPTYIHIIVDNCPAGATWNFTNVCMNWTVALVSDAGGVPGLPAPNPLPPNPPPFDGWICISAAAAVPVGTVCCFDMNLSCGGQPATIRIWAEACPCSTVGAEESTWGKIKSLYQK